MMTQILVLTHHAVLRCVVLRCVVLCCAHTYTGLVPTPCVPSSSQKHHLLASCPYC